MTPMNRYLLRALADSKGDSHSEMEAAMNLHTPSTTLFFISLVIVILALVGHVILLPFITFYGFWVAIIAYAILAFAIVMKA